MVAFRRYTLAALSSAIIAVMAAGPAHATAAHTPETFGGSGTARVLHLSLFGKDVTLGSADSTVASTLTATADGAGQLLQKLSSSSVSIKGDNTSAVDPKDSAQKCALPGLPAPLNGLVDASLACSLAKANSTAAAAHAPGPAPPATEPLH